MDTQTKWLLAATAFAVVGYFALIYGSCALDPQCHLRPCTTRKFTCGVSYDRNDVPPTQR